MIETNWFHDLTTEESKQERATLAQRLIAVLGALCFIVLVGIATNAYAEEIPQHVFEDEVVALQLFAAPCADEKAKALAANSPLAGLADKLQKATSTWLVQTPYGGVRVDFSGCWVAYTHNGREGYAVAFEDDEIRFFPTEGFKKIKGGAGA